MNQTPGPARHLRPLRRGKAWSIIATILTGAATLMATPAVAGVGGDPYPPGPGPGGSLTPTGGKAVAVDVVVSGNGLKGRPGRRHVSIPAMCWWETALGPSTDPKAMLAAYDDLTLAGLTSARFQGATWAFSTKGRIVGTTRDEFVAATAVKPAGSVFWYMAVCRDGATPSDYEAFLGYPSIGVRYATFAVGRPPDPRVDPVDLAVYANSLLDLPVPAADRNPKIIKAGGASLVGMATWFWVTDPAATGAPTGTRSVRAQARDVWAQVDATSTGIAITSDAGGTSCTPRQATTPYTPGTSETSACTLVFTKASVAHPNGWPVTITAHWYLAWTGSGNTGADLGLQPHTWTTNVPVAEVQTIVTSGG